MIKYTVKLSNSNHLPKRTERKKPNRIKYEFVTANRTRTFLYLYRNELQNMMHSSDEDIELFSIDRFGSIEPNPTFYKKKTQK
jgi:hypothetical protein